MWCLFIYWIDITSILVRVFFLVWMDTTLRGRTSGLIDTLDRKWLVGKWCISAVLMVLPSMHLWRWWQPYNRWRQREGGRYGHLLATEDWSACDVSAQCIMIAGCESRLIGFRCRIKEKNHKSTWLNITEHTCCRLSLLSMHLWIVSKSCFI